MKIWIRYYYAFYVFNLVTLFSHIIVFDRDRSWFTYFSLLESSSSSTLTTTTTDHLVKKSPFYGQDVFQNGCLSQRLAHLWRGVKKPRASIAKTVQASKDYSTKEASKHVRFNWLSFSLEWLQCAKSWVRKKGARSTRHQKLLGCITVSCPEKLVFVFLNNNTKKT